MVRFDDYVHDTLMRDLVGHDHRPASFLIYVWLATEEQRGKGGISISYRELAEKVGISKSSAQAHRLAASTEASLCAARQRNGETRVQDANALESRLPPEWALTNLNK